VSIVHETNMFSESVTSLLPW